MDGQNQQPNQEPEINVQQRINELEEKLKKYEEKDFNFQELKRKNKIVEENSQREKETVEEEKQRLEQEKMKWENQRKKDIISLQDEVIKKAAGDDEELSKKIRYHFNNFKGEANTLEVIEERVKSAKTLAGIKNDNSQTFNPLANMGSGSSVSVGYKVPVQPVSKLGLENDEQADLLRKFDRKYTPEKIKEIEEKAKNIYPSSWEELDKPHPQAKK